MAHDMFSTFFSVFSYGNFSLSLLLCFSEWLNSLHWHFLFLSNYHSVQFILLLFTLTGLAVAADRDFKTFQAAYPYVVQKLLTDNSAATRRILNSVSIIFSGFQIILLNDFWVIALHELLIFFQDKGAFKKLKIAILTLISMRVF